MTDDFRKLLGHRDGTHVDNEVIDLASFVEVHLIDRLKLLALELALKAIHAKPRITVECDSASSLITEVEAERGIALATPTLKLVAGKRLLYRPLTGTAEVGSVGIARATKGDVTPAGEKFCEILRQTSKREVTSDM